MNDAQGQPAEDLFDTYGRVEELEFDDEFAEHMAAASRDYTKHRVSQPEVREVWKGIPAYIENVGEQRSESVIMLGPTRTGRILVVPLQPTRHRGVWRPVTAYEANAHHRKRYREEIAGDDGQ